MEFSISQFTFDPKNQVRISCDLRGGLYRLVNDEIFTPNLLKTKENWTVVFYISSLAELTELTIMDKPIKANKTRELTFYVYFPKPKKELEKKAYPIDEFIEYFFIALNDILEKLEVNVSEFIPPLKLKALSIFNKDEYIYNEDDIELTNEEIEAILKEN